MAHLRKPLALALGLNTAVLMVETIGSVEANSLSLAMDALHNLSDELALAFLLLAYTLRTGLSSHFLRSANAFNSVGLLVVSGLLVWQAIERLVHLSQSWVWYPSLPVCLPLPGIGGSQEPCVSQAWKTWPFV